MPNLASFSEGGATYYELFITCPVCFSRGNLRPQAYWTHADSNCETSGRLYVGDNAHYYCKGCKKHSHVSNWKYRCPGHSGDKDEYIGVTTGELVAAIGLAAQAAGIAGTAWFKRFVDNLDE